MGYIETSSDQTLSAWNEPNSVEACGSHAAERVHQGLPKWTSQSTDLRVSNVRRMRLNEHNCRMVLAQATMKRRHH